MQISCDGYVKLDGLNEVSGVSNVYTVSQKNCAKLFLSELHQISTNFANFWQKDGKEVHLFSTSPNLRHHTTVLNADVPNCYTVL